MPNQGNGSEQRGWVARLLPILLFSDNWLSRMGIFLVTGATVFSLWFLGVGGTSAGYVGIVQFVLLPVAFFAGLALIPAGVALARRQRPQNAPGVGSINWKNEAIKRLVLFVGVVTVVNVILGGTFSYKAVHYMEGVEFCGTACHSVMSPEFTAYNNTASHSKVECVACHVGPGAANFIAAKWNGTRQLLLVNTGMYSRPIPPPLERMHSTKETCETCHSSKKDSGDKLKVLTKYSDNNQQIKTVMMLKVGSASTGKGIHGAHMGGMKITYASSKTDHSSFDWVRSTKGGASVEYFAPGKKQDSIAGLKQRDMGCLDCHNRPSHQFELPAAAVDKAMLSGEIATSLPAVKKIAVDLLNKVYTKPETELPAALSSQFKGANSADVTRAGMALAAIYTRNIYPEMKITWGTYPIHIGHTDSPGCFRCHGSDLASMDGKQIAQDCSSCHQVLAVDEAAPKILQDLGTGQ